MAFAAGPNATKYLMDTFSSSVLIAATVVDLTGEGTASSDGYSSLTSSHCAILLKARAKALAAQEIPNQRFAYFHAKMNRPHAPKASLIAAASTPPLRFQKQHFLVFEPVQNPAHSH